MKSKMKLIAGILIISVFSFASCNTNTDAEGVKAGTTALANAEHKHSYRCPMNCEEGKTYDKEGKCPVCGMTLEHHDGAEDNGLTYKIQYLSDPAQLEAGKPATISFTPKVAGKENEPVPLETVHEKKIHLIVVSNDLSYFDHIHPEYNADGSYHIEVLGKGEAYSSNAGKNETRFDNGGDYFLFADYQPSGALHQVEKVELKVAGNAKPSSSFTAEKLSGRSGQYSVTLEATGGKLITGAQMHIAGIVMKDGQQVDPNTLENYLGAKAHMVVISLDDKEYLHVHPDVAEGKFDLHTTFKKPGIYRGWIQFQAEGRVNTIDFTMNVKEGTAEEIKKFAELHKEAAGDHAGH